MVAALNHAALGSRDGTIYLDARGRDAADCLHAIFDELFECRVPLRDLRVERHLADRRAVVALEDVALTSADAQRLALGAPRCRFILTSSERVLYDGTPLALEGLADAYVVMIAEQELGRALSGRERAAAVAVGTGLGGHPLRLRQTFGRAREQGLSIEALAPRAADAYDLAAQLSEPERAVARTLAVHGDAPLGVEHIEALAGPGAHGAARALEARHDARSHSPRYSLVGAIRAAFTDHDLAPEIDRALEYFATWTESYARAGRRERVLAEADALVALMARAHGAERHAEVVRLGLAIEWALAWGNRWQAWGAVLELVLASARATGDTPAEAWALHELGTRQFGLGNAPAAATQLQLALELRERIGDEDGAAATRQNLAVVSGRPPLLMRLSHVSIALLGAIAALLVVGAIATGAAVLDDSPTPSAAEVSARLTIEVTGNGRGRVVSGGRSIRCSATCVNDLPEDRKVVLSAHPSRSAFTGWSGACRGTSRCSLTMTADRRVVARFVRRRLSVAVEGAGRVTSEPAGIDCFTRCSARFDRRDVMLIAVGERFRRWRGACATVTRPTCDVRVGSDTRVVAVFAAPPAQLLTLAVHHGGAGQGTVRANARRCDADCTLTDLRKGDVVTLTATASAGSRFAGWEGAGCQVTGPCTVTMDASKDVTARFEPAQFRLTTRVTGDLAAGNVTLSADGATRPDCAPGVCTFPAGTVVTLAGGTPERLRRALYVIRWTGCDVPPMTAQPCIVSMRRDRVVTARLRGTM